MSAADYYGTQTNAYSQNRGYNAPQQPQYASHHAPTYNNHNNSNMNGYAPPSQAQYAGAAAPSSAYGAHEQPQDGEKGFVATVVGGSAGGVLGHKVGKGSKFKTFLGAAAGAAVANAVESKMKDKHGRHGSSHHHGSSSSHHHQPQQHHSKMGGVAGLLPSSSHHGGGSSLGGLGGLLSGGKSSHHGHHGHHGHGGHGHGGW